MLILGWGQEGKVLAFMGLMKCEHCNNYSMWYLVEVSKKVKVYFVSVAKYSKKYFVLCNVCGNGYTVEEKEKNKMLEASIEIPAPETVVELWNEINNIRERYRGDSVDVDQFMDQFLAAVGELKGKYAEDDINYVLGAYTDNLMGTNRP